MDRYDPETQPEPAAWLALDEQERIELAAQFHRRARIKLPNVTAHAVFHAVVESQVAEGLPSVTRAIERLVSQGLSRHEAIHAIGAALAEHLHEAMSAEVADTPDVLQKRYDAAVERLSAKAWRADDG